MRDLQHLLSAVCPELGGSRELPCRCRGELVRSLCRDRSPEVYELVEGAGYAIEADRLKPNFAHESCVLEGGGRVVRGEAVEEG